MSEGPRPEVYAKDATDLFVENGHIYGMFIENEKTEYTYGGTLYWMGGGGAGTVEEANDDWYMEEFGVFRLDKYGCAQFRVVPGEDCPCNTHHVCSPEQYLRSMRMMEWAWRLAQSRIQDYSEEEVLK